MISNLKLNKERRTTKPSPGTAKTLGTALLRGDNQPIGQETTEAKSSTMPVSGEYTWTDKNDRIEVAIPLKGVSAKKVDVFTASTILKVSYSPFLLDLNLHGEIDEDSSRAVLKNGTLTVSLTKKSSQPWSQLCFEGTKEEIKQRREKAMEERDAEVQRQRERTASKKVEEERMVFRRHMALEERERQRMDQIKAVEKKEAEDAMYDAFSQLQTAKSDENPPTTGGYFEAESTPGDLGVKSTACANQEPQDCRYELDPEVPPPRKVAHATFRHTPRLFKTPSRESTVKQEQEFIVKNRSNLNKNALLNDVDIGDVDPVWLNSKGDEFYGKGDFYSAINAYSEALRADETMVGTLGNRAACYLHLREGECCRNDCLTALKMKDAIELHFNTLLEQNQFRKKTHIRLAMAYCLNEEYSSGMEHFTKAHSIDANDKIAAESIDYLKTLMESTRLKSEADRIFAGGDIPKAMELYTKAIDIDPKFAKARMNRSASFLAMKSFANCIEDCTCALNLISSGKPRQQLAVILLPKPIVRRKWAATLLCRRAAAKRLNKDFEGALADLEEAKASVRRGDDIDIKEVEASIEGLKKEMAV